jgi:RNA polymerase sigma-70 factor (ECF subfamily)
LAARSKRLQPARSLDGLAVWRPLRPELEGLSDELQRALAPMRSDYRRAFLLFHQDELSYQEIAAALDCPLGTVKTWVHRARRELAERLIENGVVEANVLDLR